MQTIVTEFKIRMPSLEQEMNLARRACWCYSNINNTLNTKQTQFERKVKQQQQQQQQQKSDEIFNKENNRFNYVDIILSWAIKQSIITIQMVTILKGANNFSKFFHHTKLYKINDTKYFNSNNQNYEMNDIKNVILCFHMSNISDVKYCKCDKTFIAIIIIIILTTTATKTIYGAISISKMDVYHSNGTMNYKQGYHNDNDRFSQLTAVTAAAVTAATATITHCNHNNNSNNNNNNNNNNNISDNVLPVKRKNYNCNLINHANNHSSNNKNHNNCNNHLDVAYVKLLNFFWCIFLRFGLNYISSFYYYCITRYYNIMAAEFVEEKRIQKKIVMTRPTKKSFLLFTESKLLSTLLWIYLFLNCVHYIEGRPEVDIKNDVSTPSHIANNNNNNMNAAPKFQLDALAKVANLQVGDIDRTMDESVKQYGKMEAEHKPDSYPLSQVDFDRVKTPFIIGIWILSASIAKIGFHMTPKLHLIFPESCLLIVVGVVIGVVLYFSTEVGVSPLTPNTFFFYMLPPIILDAGYFMPNRLFFDNLGTILLMAVIGTIFNIATIGGSLWACGTAGIFGSENETPELLHTFIFASLISAVDPVAVLAVFEEIHVNEILYIVVFGESLLNDAVTVVMYHMMEVYNEMGISNIEAKDIVSGVGSFFVVALGGTIIGVIWGFLTGLVTRFTDHVRVIEPIFIFVMAYLAYLNAEIFHMSGIMAITFCGITMKNYVESNISQKSHTTVKYALKMLSSSSETIIFMFLGVATVNKGHVWNTAFVTLTIVFCSFFRAVGVIILSALANRFRLHKLSRVDQFVMSYGGLRGAVAFALVLLIDEDVVPQKHMFVTTTIAVIYFTVFVQGITIKPLVKILNVKRANKRKPTMNERIHERFMDHLMAGVEDIVGKTGNYNVRDKFKRFDNRFIRPLLIRDLKQGAEPKIMETYSKLTMRDAIEVMRRNPSTIGQITGTESMSALFRNYTNNYIGGSPSLTNLDNTCSRNLDMHELDYNPSKKDLTDAKIHHLLAEELKPYRRHRRLSYSRHAVDDRDLSTQVNYKMQMHFRRMFNDRKHYKRSKRGGNKHHPDGSAKQSHVSFHDFQQNGTTKQLSQEEDAGRLSEVVIGGPGDDWDDGLTFTAKPSPDSDRANNNSLIAHIQNLPGFDTSKARIVQHYATTKTSNHLNNKIMSTTDNDDEASPEKLQSPEMPLIPTAAELILPWRRDRFNQSYVVNNVIPEEDRNFTRDSDGEHRVATPTATESQLPWKRQGDELSDAVQQNEFPAWASNKEYLAYNSPSATFLGGINKPKQHKSVIGLFRRESSVSRGTGGSLVGENIETGSAPGSDPALAAILSNMVNPPIVNMNQNSRMDKRSQSIAAASNLGDGHAGPFPVTASHRRNTRRGSMLELSGDIIPEETYYHGHSKSLCEPQGEEWESVLANAEQTQNVRPHSERLLKSSGREPLLSKLTPRAQIRRGMSAGSVGFSIGGGGLGGGGGGGGGGCGGVGVNGGDNKIKVTTALLSTSYSDYEDEEDDDDDDDDDEDDNIALYDENIVVTTTTTTPTKTAGSKGATLDETSSNSCFFNRSDGNISTTTTTIRLIRKNDESII